MPEITENTDPTSPQGDETPEGDPITPGTDEHPAEDAQTFSAEYVSKLRDEAAGYRVKAQRTDELAHRLHTELVRATGRLADPADLAFDAEHLADTEKLTAAIDELLTAKPHLASRTLKGDAGQGNRGTGEQPTNLLSILRNFA